MSEKDMELKIKEVAARIRAVREDVGLTQAELAEKIGISTEEYAQYEEGKRDFGFTFIYKCALFCGVEITDLLEGQSPSLTSYTVTRSGEGQPIARRKGFEYNRLAPYFKNKLAEPFLVKIPYNEQQDRNDEIPLSTHDGQELDIIISGSIKVKIDGHTEVLSAGDSIYYESSTPHGMIATGGAPAEMYAIVMNPGEISEPKMIEEVKSKTITNVDKAGLINPVAAKFVSTKTDENGLLTEINFTNEDSFNFAYDIMDALAEKCPDKVAMVHVSREHECSRFTYSELMHHVNMTANYFKSLGINKGDRVMLVLKRHYQFWFSILALHKIGAVAIPSTNMLVQEDFEYRFNAAGVKAIVCTSDEEVAHHVESALPASPTVSIKVIVGAAREGWHDFNSEYSTFSDVFTRQKDAACGEDPMIMFFTSGTTGYPKIAVQSFKYALGHYITAKYWHNVDPDGLHLTISDTGWGKALWGKLYGQWMNETAVFVYDFDKFKADDILPMFKEYNITSFCAPPTMYRFFIKEDLSKYDLSSIKHSTVAGEALNPEVYEQWKRATGLKLMEGFGQTETTLVVANLVGMDPKPGSMGKPSPLYDVDIINPDGTSAKVGETGEIVIRTSEKIPCGLFSGYYQNEEKTRETWHDGYYHTGDTAWRDEDGYFWYVGRTDDLIKSSGYRIGPFEIESVIMELPYVLECAVTGVPDPIRGQVVKATIVLTKGTTPSDELKKEIQEYVKHHTAPYKYPRVVEFVEELPKTISGKIRRVELRQKDAN